MRLFLDTTVLLAAAGSATGASRCLLGLKELNDWDLFTADYCVEEALRNLPRFKPHAFSVFEQLIIPRLTTVSTRLVFDRPVMFKKRKDRPVLMSALGVRADYLITLDIADFQRVLGTQIYSMKIRDPGLFLVEQRRTGKLREM